MLCFRVAHRGRDVPIGEGRLWRVRGLGRLRGPPVLDGAHGREEVDASAARGVQAEVDELADAVDVGVGEGGQPKVEVDGPGVVNDQRGAVKEMAVRGEGETEIGRGEVGVVEGEARVGEVGCEATLGIDWVCQFGDGKLGAHEGGKDEAYCVSDGLWRRQCG